MQRVTGEAETGNITITTVGVASTTIAMGSFPAATVTVYNSGTLNLSTLYSDNAVTLKANPFTAASDGSWFFYAANGRYDIVLTGTAGDKTINRTIGDVLLNDFASVVVAPSTVAFSATPVFDLNVASWFIITLTGNVTAPTFPNALTGSFLYLTIKQDGTGGRTWTWPATFLRPPIIASDANAVTELTFKYDGTNWRVQSASGDNTQLRVANGERFGEQFTSIQAAINDPANGGVVKLPPGTFVLGGTGLTMRAGVQLIGSGPNSTILTYTGNAAAISLDSIAQAGVRDLQLQIGTSATAIGIQLQNTTGDCKWNIFENLYIATSALTAGQFGIQGLCSTTNALYWNIGINLTFNTIDTCIQLTNSGVFAANGANDNRFFGVTCHYFSTGISFQKYATENQVFGLSCSASGNPGVENCVIIGDGAVACNYNMISGLVSDTGANGRAFQVKAGAVQNVIRDVVDTGSLGSTDAGTNTAIINMRNATQTMITLPQVIMGTPTLSGDTSAALFVNADASKYATFGQSAWAQRIMTTAAGRSAYGAVGVKKTANDNNFIAFTGNNAAVNHAYWFYDITGQADYFYQVHQVDGTILAAGSIFTIDGVNNKVSASKGTFTSIVNSSLVVASSGNSVTLLNSQDPGNAITGDGTDKTIYTYSLPANTMQAGKGIRIKIAALNGSAAATTYKIKFGATTVWTGTTAAATDAVWAEATVFNNAAVQNAQHTTAMGFAAATAVGNAVTTPAEDTVNAVTILLTANVANPNTFTGKGMIVELIQ